MPEQFKGSFDYYGNYTPPEAPVRGADLAFWRKVYKAAALQGMCSTGDWRDLEDGDAITRRCASLADDMLAEDAAHEKGGG